jgi:Integrase zinc binding domain
MDKWKATLPLLTISTVQYDTHMTSQLMIVYLQDAEFVKQFQSPKALYVLRDGHLYREGRFCFPNGSLRGILLQDHHDAVTAGHREATKTIKTLQHQYYRGSLAKDVRDYVVCVTHVSAQSPIDDAVPVSSPRMRYPCRSGPKCSLISSLKYQKRILVILD